MLDRPVAAFDTESIPEPDIDLSNGRDEMRDTVAREPFQGWVDAALTGWPMFLPDAMRSSAS